MKTLAMAERKGTKIRKQHKCRCSEMVAPASSLQASAVDSELLFDSACWDPLSTMAKDFWLRVHEEFWHRNREVGAHTGQLPLQLLKPLLRLRLQISLAV